MSEKYIPMSQEFDGGVILRQYPDGDIEVTIKTWICSPKQLGLMIEWLNEAKEYMASQHDNDL